MIDVQELKIGDVTREDLFGPLEVTTKELGKILSISPVTISSWVQMGKIKPTRTSALGGGRPGFVFDLEMVREHLVGADLDVWPQAEGYLEAVEAEIEHRNAEEARRQIRETNSTPQEPTAMETVDIEAEESHEAVVLRDEIRRLQDLVIDLAVAYQRGTELSTQNQLDILDVLLARVEIHHD